MTVSSILVSIIVPAFNAEKFIAAALASIAAQTEQRYEIIVIDDCSSDQTAAIVKNLAEADPRIKQIALPHNRGPGVARNIGIEAARGRWIALLDADDLYCPKRLETLLEIAERRNADMVSDNILPCSVDGIRSAKPMYSAERLPAEILLTTEMFVAENIAQSTNARTAFGFMQPIIAREFILRHGICYNNEARFGEDFILYVKCLVAGARWWLTPEPLYLYRVYPGSLSENASTNDLRVIRQFEQGLLDDPTISHNPALKNALKRHKKGIDHWYCKTQFNAHLKSHNFQSAVMVAFQNRRNLVAVSRDIAGKTFLRDIVHTFRRR